MLTIIAPFGLDGFFRSVISELPILYRIPVFSILLTIYLYVLVGFLNATLCRVDFFVATFFRKIGSRPPDLQIWLGQFCEKAPQRIVTIGCLLVAGSIIYSVMNAIEPIPRNGFWYQFSQYWQRLIMWLWK